MRPRALVVCAVLAACARGPRARSEQPVAPEAVQVLVQADTQLNLSREREPWPVEVSLYVLKAEPDEDLDFEAVLSGAAEVFGERLAGEAKTFKAYPGQTMVEVLPVAPEASHILAVAAFREPIGTYWYQTFEIPRVRSTADAPCFYLGLERSEIGGGLFPPPGFDTAAFSVPCPSVSRPAASAADDSKRREPPRLPPASSLPSPPEAPQPPTAPTAPKASAPQGLPRGVK